MATRNERPNAAEERASTAPYARPGKAKGEIKSESKLSSEGYTSVRENSEKSAQYRRMLQKGTSSVPGILEQFDKEGYELIEYDHQRQFVKKAAASERNFILCAHDAGLGKTASWMQLYAFLELMKVNRDGSRGGARAIVVAPPACLNQWEDTANAWLSLPNKKICIVQTTRRRMIDVELLRRVRVLIISRHLLEKLYTECWEYKSKYEKNSRGSWVGKWVRKEGVPLHPFWRERWDLLGVDEAHFMRNPSTAWCESHYQLSMGFACNGEQVGGCIKRVAISATPIFNGPMDIVGVCKCMGASPEFLDKRVWSLDKQCKTINPATTKAFQKHTDRVKDEILKLPEIHQETIDFRPELGLDDVHIYNNYLNAARKLKLSMEKSGKSQSQDLQKLMLLLARMQQILVSSRLAETGAEHFKKHPEEVPLAAEGETGSLKTLHREILRFQREGHSKVIIAACHVTIMHIAAAYLDRKGAENPEDSIGNIFTYDGTCSMQRRTEERMQFMATDKSVLFLSIGAGGTGLHLVPSNPSKREKNEFCRAMLFWGSRPFSPQQVWQTLKRIHRIGQRFECYVRHIIAQGSVDHAIEEIHEDKSGLANAVVDNDWSNCDEAGGEWRSKGRIVDMCCPVDDDGNFMPQPSSRMPGKDQARPASPSLTAARAVPVQSKFFNQSAAASASASASASAPSVPVPQGDDRQLLVKLKVPPKPRKPIAPERPDRTVTFGPATLVVPMDTNA